MFDQEVLTLLRQKMARAVVDVTIARGEAINRLRKQLLPQGQTGAYIAQCLGLLEQQVHHQVRAAWEADRSGIFRWDGQAAHSNA